MLRASQGSDEDDRGVALTGDAARSWLAERGYTPQLEGSALRVAGDAIRTEDFALLRIWHNAARIDRSPTRGGQVIGFVLEGKIDLDIEERTTSVGSSEGYYYESALQVKEKTSGSTALVEVHLGPEVLLRLGIPRGEGLRRIDSGLTSSRVFVAVVSAMLSAPLTSSDVHFLDLRRSAESAVKGVFNEAHLTDRFGTGSRSARLRHRASAIIERRHADPGFSVMTLVDEADVSRSGLHAAFAEIGTTPLMEIRKARVDTAVAMLGEHSSDPREVSHAAGFRSVQAMKRAIRLFGEEVDLDGEEPGAVG